MCGIFAYIGRPEKAVEFAIDGLKKLEYRGYDSAGIAGIFSGKVIGCKEVGKVSVLEKEIQRQKLKLDIALAHTRWATHGEPSRFNAHPHYDSKHSLALVHNGIIENYAELKDQLVKQGIRFLSDTDTEVIAHLVSSFYEGDLIQAVQKTIPLLKGAFAIALIHREHPDMIIAVANESPMVIGVGNGEAFVASDSNAFSGHTRHVVFLHNNEIAVVKSDRFEVFSADMAPVAKETEELSHSLTDISKGQYEHYTLKEIHEQPQTVRNAMASRFLEEYGTAFFEGIADHGSDLHALQRILILACGSSWHAAYVASYMIEDNARIPVQVEISSEFRYKNPIVAPNTLVIAISQSGETADTIAAVRELKAKGAKIFALCNVHGSTLAREADYTIFLHAGPEIGVASTKAFTSQLVVLSLFSLLLARMRHMSKEEGALILDHLKMLPEQIKAVLALSSHIKAIAKKYAHYENFFYLGRHYMYPTALEGALKLKEISYINANGYPAGEMKHGPIALINPDCPTVALCCHEGTYDKMLSNLMEVKARKGLIIAVVKKGQKKIETIADDIITIPATIDELSSITTTVVTQLLAYYIAYEREAEIDQPRNLAKSVTVE